MLNNRQKWRLTLCHLGGIASGYVGVILIQLLLMHLGAFLSHFSGVISWHGMRWIASAQSWGWWQVMGLFLLPYLGMAVLYVFISWHRQQIFKFPAWLLLLRNWLYVILLVMVFYMPMWDILQRHGIYHVFNWLYIGRKIQLLFGLVMWMLFLIRLFRSSSLFSSNLVLQANQYVTSKQIGDQLYFLWYIPLFVFFFLILVASAITKGHVDWFFLSGLLLVLLCNTWLIRRYRVLVK